MNLFDSQAFETDTALERSQIASPRILVGAIPWNYDRSELAQME